MKPAINREDDQLWLEAARKKAAQQKRQREISSTIFGHLGILVTTLREDFKMTEGEAVNSIRLALPAVHFADGEGRAFERPMTTAEVNAAGIKIYE